MPVFTYEAKDNSGQTINGEVSAADERSAAAQVRALGHYPIRFERASAMRPAGTISTTAVLDPAVVSSVDYQRAHPSISASAQAQAQAQSQTRQASYSAPGIQWTPNSFRESTYGLPQAQPHGSWFEQKILNPIWTGVSMPALAMYYRQFAAMLSAGMTINRTLETMQAQSDAPLRRISVVMKRHIEAGGKLSEAMSMFPHVFREMHRAIIEAAEGTGALDGAFIRLSQYVEADYELRRVIKRETFMPKINFVATFLIPTLVIAVTQGMQAYFTQAVVPLLRLLVESLCVYVVGRYALSLRPVSVIYDTVKSYLPYFGNTVRMLSNAKFARALSALYSAGILLPTAVRTAARVSGNMFLSYRMNKAADAMLSGSGLTEAFEQAGVFPPMFISMIRTGETTGSLDVLLDKVAGFYEDESAVRLKQSVQAFNVIIFLIVAVIVAKEVIGFYTGYGSQLTDIMNSS